MQAMEIKPTELKDKNKAERSNSINKAAQKPKSLISDLEATKILEEVDRLLSKGQTLQCINLLRALKDNMQAVKNQNITALVIINLGILYYQVGFLEEANEEFSLVIPKLKEMSQKIMNCRAKDMLRIKYETVLSKLELQVCILYSELGKHDMALQHAKLSSKICYNLIYDVLAKLYNSLNKLLISKNYQKQQQQELNLKEDNHILHNIAVLNKLLNTTKDLKLAFIQKERLIVLEEQTQITRRYGHIPHNVDIEQLYDPEERSEFIWIYKNKILDEIQLMPFELNQFEDLEIDIDNSEVIEKITYLAISLYCYSTETRFIEKLQQCDSHDVLDSEHWLSRSLQIAYCFLPPEAPILNQIITVHDRFHGLDKQTIPQDQEVTGFFKVLKPLSKPKSTYNSKSPGYSPIMIRIQADKVDVQMQTTSKTAREMPMARNLIQLDQNKTLDIDIITKNNKIRNYSHGHKRIETTDAALHRPVISSRTTIDIPLLHNPNIRTNYASKKFGKKKEQRMRVNMSELNGKAIISEDLLSRPHSLENKVNMSSQQANRLLGQKRKKSLPSKRTQLSRKPNTLGNQIKFQGLELKGHRMEDTVQSQFFERLHNQTKVMEATRLGGNVYINNNINLFISRQPQGQFGQTFVRGQIQKKQEEKQLNRRQMFLNKRRANNFVALEEL